MCAIKNLSKTKALETAPIHENEILTYIFKVNQYYCLLSLSIITRNKAGALGLGTSKNVSGVSNSLLQYCCDGSFFSILFAFSAIKGPAKELKLSFMSGEKYVNKTFLLFSGSESAKMSPN